MQQRDSLTASDAPNQATAWWPAPQFVQCPDAKINVKVFHHFAFYADLMAQWLTNKTTDRLESIHISYADDHNEVSEKHPFHQSTWNFKNVELKDSPVP